VGVVLDSSILIAAERAKFDLPCFIEEELATEVVYISVITVSELLHGVKRAKARGNQKAQRAAFVESIISETPVLNFDIFCARSHSQLWADLAKAGKLIGSHDMLIAATCLCYQHQIATLNRREFSQVAGLKLCATEQYEIR